MGGYFFNYEHNNPILSDGIIGGSVEYGQKETMSE